MFTFYTLKHNNNLMEHTIFYISYIYDDMTYITEALITKNIKGHSSSADMYSYQIYKRKTNSQTNTHQFWYLRRNASRREIHTSHVNLQSIWV